MRTRQIIIIIAAALIIATPAGSIAAGRAPARVASVRAAVRAGNAAWIAAVTAGNPEGIAALFDEKGAEVSLRNGTVTKGREKVLEAWKGYLKDDHPRKATVTTTSLGVTGAHACEMGKYAYTYSQAGKDTVITGQYVVVWKRQAGGGWKILVDMGIPRD